MKVLNKLLAVALTTFIMTPFAFAAEAPADGAGGSGWQSILLLVVFFAIFYFLLIRPQMKRNKEHRQMLSEVTKGDEIVTNGGIVGKVEKVGESFIDVAVAENVIIQVQKQAIASILPKGSTNS